jgi:hypothetical protein
MRKLLLAGVVMASVFGISEANAQITAGAGAVSDSFAGVSNVIVNGQPGGGGGGGVGYLQQNVSGVVWTLGNTPSMASQSYDACLKNLSVAGPGAGINIPLEIAVCWNLRMMDAMAKYPPGSNQYEMGCLDSNWLKTDWNTNTMRCTENIKKLPANDPRRVTHTGTPVVLAGHGAVVPQNTVPPTGVAVPATNAPIAAAPLPSPRNLPRCKGPNDQSQCYSG